MNTLTEHLHFATEHPVDVRLEPAEVDRDRLTVFFRFFLAIPHILLVGAPIGFATLGWSTENGLDFTPAMGGALGAVAGVCALIAWFSLVFNGVYPDGLRKLALLYLRWRVRAVAYTALFRDEYPPFGDAPYPASLSIRVTDQPRDRLSIAFRLILAIPHLFALAFLTIGWALATLVAWFAILVSGYYPDSLYNFSLGVFRWSIRVEAYLLLLGDEYPPFSLD